MGARAEYSHGEGFPLPHALVAVAAFTFNEASNFLRGELGARETRVRRAPRQFRPPDATAGTAALIGEKASASPAPSKSSRSGEQGSQALVITAACRRNSATRGLPAQVVG